MEALGWPQNANKLLFIGAHCDDIEIGCGGTILRLLAQRPDLELNWVVLSSNAARESETRRAAGMLMGERATSHIDFQEFRNGYFPTVAAELKDYFESLKAHEPDVVFSHYRNDLHQDHRLVSELTWNTFRDQLILEYEIPKYDGDLGNPNFFVKLSSNELDRKVQVLMDSFPSQAEKRWFVPETFQGLAQLRAVQAGMERGNVAEGFYVQKVVV